MAGGWTAKSFVNNNPLWAKQRKPCIDIKMKNNTKQLVISYNQNNHMMCPVDGCGNVADLQGPGDIACATLTALGGLSIKDIRHRFKVIAFVCEQHTEEVQDKSRM
jgi:hypothetical protein